ncbi:bifunctional 4-hydroxy-2-oxoglutarate aldolase/2-dehydro-3-deoxy-phosphogluconate aldolase [Algibacter agarivorans]|uniref:Bifunctional 4-hydroxy-2-oxoglutarate aldolase/2-dehydro-3-deoxy-phosphogluconate aldolase n=2 Tax=Algibacter agarivorans TaxID=1109741 RepID=A0ABP9GD27_9FLAO
MSEKATLLKVVETYISVGFYTLEITMNTDGVLDLIEALRTEFPELNVGAGTVCTIEDYTNAVNCGAQFIVTPIVNEDVIKQAVSSKTPIFPGAFTPTEIYKAWSLGADAVKVFPATQLGPGYIKDILAPLNNIKLIPTGGVTLENIKTFFQAGAIGVGMGGNLLNKRYILNHDFERIKSDLIKIKNEIDEFIEL